VHTLKTGAVLVHAEGFRTLSGKKKHEERKKEEILSGEGDSNVKGLQNGGKGKQERGSEKRSDTAQKTASGGKHGVREEPFR